MRYPGGKARIGKKLLEHIVKDRKPGQWYVEPFVGGANVIKHVENPRLAADKNYYLIEMYKALQKGWIPPTEVSREMHTNVRKNKDAYSPELVGFVLIACSYGGNFTSGYAYDREGTNYAERGSRILRKEAEMLAGTTFVCCDYKHLQIPKDSIVYCDPPYKNVSYRLYGHAIDHDEFWDWCREKASEGHSIYISGYEAPNDFECILEIQIKSLLKPPHKTITERLFTYKP